MSPATIDLPQMLKRLHLPTVARNLAEVETQAASEGWGIREALAVLCAHEVANRNNTRIAKAVRRARFPFLKTIEEFDFAFATGLRRDLLSPYLCHEFVTEGRNVIFNGKSGRGKTALSIAIAYRAIQNGFDALFTTAKDLIEDLVRAARSGNLAKATAMYRDPDVLIIDEVGYLPYVDDAANVLYGVVDARYLAKRPMLFTTNQGIEQWGEVLHNANLAEALLDRVLERGRQIVLTGPSCTHAQHATDTNAHRRQACWRASCSTSERSPQGEHRIPRGNIAS